MEIDNGQSSSSDDEVLPPSSFDGAHTAELKINAGSERSAEIICRTLLVDKEPSRSKAVRELRTDGCYVVMEVKSADRRSLQKSVANLLDMCELAKSTIEFADAESWIGIDRPVAKKAKHC